MPLSYNCTQYIAKVKMSSKQRILVEGKDDKSHLRNLLKTIFGLKHKSNILVDTAEQIVGDCSQTSKNNKAKIEKIYYLITTKPDIDNLLFLRDREFDNFIIKREISETHMIDRNPMYITQGHSFENYFLTQSVILKGLSHHTSSQFKLDAIEAFKSNFDEIFSIISCISLVTKDLGIGNYAHGKIYWDDFSYQNGIVSFDIEDWYLKNQSEMNLRFKSKYCEYYPITSLSKTNVCINITKGHTAIIMLQRFFAFFLYKTGLNEDEELARREAIRFSKISEHNIASSLSQSWLDSIKEGSKKYPVTLIGYLESKEVA